MMMMQNKSFTFILNCFILFFSPEPELNYEHQNSNGRKCSSEIFAPIFYKVSLFCIAKRVINLIQISLQAETVNLECL